MALQRFDVTNYGTPYSGVRIDVDEADGWWGGTMWYYDGYETLDELYQEAVTDNLDSYKHEDNVNEKLAAASETKKKQNRKIKKKVAMKMLPKRRMA